MELYCMRGERSKAQCLLLPVMVAVAERPGHTQYWAVRWHQCTLLTRVWEKNSRHVDYRNNARGRDTPGACGAQVPFVIAWCGKAQGIGTLLDLAHTLWQRAAPKRLDSGHDMFVSEDGGCIRSWAATTNERIAKRSVRRDKGRWFERPPMRLYFPLPPSQPPSLPSPLPWLEAAWRLGGVAVPWATGRRLIGNVAPIPVILSAAWPGHPYPVRRQQFV